MCGVLGASPQLAGVGVGGLQTPRGPVLWVQSQARRPLSDVSPESVLCGPLSCCCLRVELQSTSQDALSRASDLGSPHSSHLIELSCDAGGPAHCTCIHRDFTASQLLNSSSKPASGHREASAPQQRALDGKEYIRCEADGQGWVVVQGRSGNSTAWLGGV